MLTNSFIHIPSVGYTTEQKIWRSGISGWDNFNLDKLNLPAFKALHIKKYVDLSIESYAKGDYEFFSSLLPSHEHWRCLADYKKIAFLDIETTGLDKSRDDITVIGVYDGESVKTFVKGEDFLSFPEYISSFPMIVTFNGACFDLPFISSKFGINFNQLHLDLRFAFSRLGYKGGLKRIEKAFGLQRSDETDGMDGFEAVRLWYKYLNGDDSALALLKKYNTEDIVGLKTLAANVYKLLKNKFTDYVK
ncbi:MAG: ribonuclease H-like domain-containing protein [Nanoarchaeota archaeon]